MTLEELNALRLDEARDTLLRCCGSHAWAERLAAARPFRGPNELARVAERTWWSLGPDDWKQALASHPRIGDLESLRRKYATTADWARSEQAGAAAASEATLAALDEGNRAYEERFGYQFIVCATGRSAEEMLALLRVRLRNPPEVELRAAAAEQVKITALRLEKLFKEGP